MAAEEARGVGKIGTTAKGIGPAYEDKAGRRGLRAGDLRHPDLFRRQCSEVVAEKNRIASALFGGAALDPVAVADQLPGNRLSTSCRFLPTSRRI